jgi:alkenylglycerophosphocholine hydrolase
MGIRLAGRTGVLAGVGILSGALFLLELETGSLALRLSTKALPIVCLLAWLWPPQERYARRIFVGLILSLAGDMLLQVDPSLFLPGLGAFLLAHVAYIAAYLSVTRSPHLGRALPFALFGVGTGVLLWPGLGGMALPVTAYVAVICTMMWRSAAMVGDAGLARRGQWAALAGALLFAASDGLLAFKLFVSPMAGASYAIMLLYWAGQLCIALSARRLRTAHGPREREGEVIPSARAGAPGG